MGIKEEIFQEYFRKLEEEKEIPEIVLTGLKQFETSKKGISEEELLDLIKRGCKDVHDDKEH